MSRRDDLKRDFEASMKEHGVSDRNMELIAKMKKFCHSEDCDEWTYECPAMCCENDPDGLFWPHALVHEAEFCFMGLLCKKGNAETHATNLEQLMYLFTGKGNVLCAFMEDKFPEIREMADEGAELVVEAVNAIMEIDEKLFQTSYEEFRNAIYRYRHSLRTLS